MHAVHYIVPTVALALYAVLMVLTVAGG